MTNSFAYKLVALPGRLITRLGRSYAPQVNAFFESSELVKTAFHYGLYFLSGNTAFFGWMLVAGGFVRLIVSCVILHGTNILLSAAAMAVGLLGIYLNVTLANSYRNTWLFRFLDALFVLLSIQIPL